MVVAFKEDVYLQSIYTIETVNLAPSMTTQAMLYLNIVCARYIYDYNGILFALHQFAIVTLELRITKTPKEHNRANFMRKIWHQAHFWDIYGGRVMQK